MANQQSNNYFVSVGIFNVWESHMIYSNLYFKNRVSCTFVVCLFWLLYYNVVISRLSQTRFVKAKLKRAVYFFEDSEIGKLGTAKVFKLDLILSIFGPLWATHLASIRLGLDYA